jgi:dienelactone hydrolase
MNSWASPNTVRLWERARRRAFVQDVLSAFTQRQADLLPFDQVRASLHLNNARYLGLQDVPVDQIVGSVGRHQDFTRAFLPRAGIARERWLEIARLTAIIDGNLPPVELYKVGQLYFVRDGNHRVSAARQQQRLCVEALVWEYETRVALEPGIALDELLVKAACAAFLEHTNVDEYLCSGMRIELTQPEGYDDLLHQIEAFQYSLSRIDERQVPFAEAVELWCEMRYTPIVEIIRKRNILRGFPGRTEADLYLWLCRNQEELATRYGRDVLLDEAAEDLAGRFGEKPSSARRVKKTVRRLAGGLSGLGPRLGKAGASSRQAQADEAVATALLASIGRAARATAEMATYRFRGTAQSEWEVWHSEFHRRLWELLGVGGYPWQPYDAASLNPEVAERLPVNGLVRELVWLNTEADLRVPAYLFRPDQVRGPIPAVVVFPGQGTIAQAAGLEDSPQQANALELARAGFITLAVEPRGFGRLGAVGYQQLDAVARLVGRTWHGLVVQDGLRAIDYLHTRTEVDPAHLGVAGIGAGGAQAMYAAALDDRVQAAVITGYLGRYLAASLDQDRCTCNDIPGILRYAEMGDVAALIAPRPAMFVNGRNDPTINPGACEALAIARHVYQVLEVPQRIRLIEPETSGRQFDNQLAVAWLSRWLDIPPQASRPE